MGEIAIVLALGLAAGILGGFLLLTSIRMLYQ
jgi:hypothetical protein